MITRLLACVCLVGLIPAVDAAAPPAPLTAEQQEQIAQRNRWLQRANTRYAAGQIEGTIEAIEKGLALERSVFGSVRASSLRWLASQARLQERSARFPEALAVWREVLQRTEELYGKDDWRVTNALLDLEDTRLVARLDAGTRQRLVLANQRNEQVVRLWQQGKSKQALPLAQQVLAVRREILGEKHRATALGWFNLGAQHERLAHWIEAERCYRQALAIRKETLGQKHPDCATSLNGLGWLCRLRGDYARGRRLVEQALAIRKAALGEQHADCARSLTTLGWLWRDLGDNARARSLFEQARDTFKAALGEKHPDYATSLNNLGMLYSNTGQYAKALPLLRQALDLRKELLGEKHRDYAASLHNLAMVIVAMGHHARALPMLEQALAIRKATLGKKHPDSATTLASLGLLYSVRQDYSAARQLLGMVAESYQGHLDTTFSALSDRQRLDLLARSRENLNNYLSIPVSPATASADYKRVLAWKAAVLARQAEERLLRDEPDLAKLLGQLRAVRAGLARWSSQQPTAAEQAQWLKQFTALEQEKESLEVRLAAASAGFRVLRQIEPAALAAALPAGCVLVDLLVYRHVRSDPDHRGLWLPEHRLTAFVLHPGGRVQRVELGAAAAIEKAVLAWRKPLEASPPGAPDDKAALLLRQKLWLPLQAVVGRARTVLISPDGGLCGLPFAALPGSKHGSYLIEELAVLQLPSARLLLELPGNRAGRATGLLAVGGLDYGKGGAWTDLPGTAVETARVARVYGKRFPDARTALLLAGKAGNRAGLLAALSGKERWRYLHLASHGFFALPDKDTPHTHGGVFSEQRVELTYRRNPLLLSGLVLAEANTDPAGLLTAEEVASWDLRLRPGGAERCQTGLGRVAGGEGVMGLQRALHLAGARAVLASLWSVNDPAASVLMEEFYEQLWGKKQPPLEALRRAQLFVLLHPAAVHKRAAELRDVLVKREVPEAMLALRGLGKKAMTLPAGGTGQRRSPVVWWAPWVLSGAP